MTIKQTNTVFFLLGVVIGAGGTLFHLHKKKLEKKYREEAQEMREVYVKKAQEAQEAAERNDEEKGADISEYVAKRRFEEERARNLEIIQSHGYSEEEEPEPDGVELIEEPEKIQTYPYIITPHEYGEREGYETIEYKYFDDGVLADENGEEMGLEDIANSVGIDAVSHFGEYEDDSVYVRNERHRCDYAIFLMDQDYDAFLKTRPKPMLMEDI